MSEYHCYACITFSLEYLIKNKNYDMIITVLNCTKKKYIMPVRMVIELIDTQNETLNKLILDIICKNKINFIKHSLSVNNFSTFRYLLSNLKLNFKEWKSLVYFCMIDPDWFTFPVLDVFNSNTNYTLKLFQSKSLENKLLRRKIKKHNHFEKVYRIASMPILVEKELSSNKKLYPDVINIIVEYIKYKSPYTYQ